MLNLVPNIQIFKSIPKACFFGNRRKGLRKALRLKKYVVKHVFLFWQFKNR